MRWAAPGTNVVQKHTEPKMVARPNSVILIPCLWKESIVTAHSGTEIPKAMRRPKTVVDIWYLVPIFPIEGIKNFSLMMPLASSMYTVAKHSK